VSDQEERQGVGFQAGGIIIEIIPAERVTNEIHRGGVKFPPGQQVIAVWNARQPSGPVLYFTKAEWATFIAGVKAQGLDEMLIESHRAAQHALAEGLDLDGELRAVIDRAAQSKDGITSSGRTTAIRGTEQQSARHEAAGAAVPAPSQAHPPRSLVYARATGPFLSSLDDVERTTLRDTARPRTYTPGMHLCYEGDPSDHVIVIENGWAKVTSTTEDGHEVMHSIRGPGDIVGESAVLGHRPSSATITALGPLRALVLSATRFTAFLDDHPRVWRMVSGTLVRRTDDDVRRLRAKASADGAQRLAMLLLELAERYGSTVPTGGVVIQPPLSQSELASWVDSSRETVARALKIWRSRGLIGASRRKITVMNVDGLRAVATGSSDYEKFD
jgi:CRP/FNR family cyclic AMP-dependent transcriptional regulator